MCDPITIASHRGLYVVEFEAGPPFQTGAPGAGSEAGHVLIDARVAELYKDALSAFVAGRPVLRIEAAEPAKSLERCPDYVEALVAGGVRRGQALVAIGGGVLQDITCFLAAVLLRGLPWEFYPTTLLAQADSCIGSKSSINVGSIKNIVGTFTPPRRVVINPQVLRTLHEVEVRSGIGEMLKVHAIAGPDAFDRIAQDYDRLGDDDVRLGYIRQSLLFKKTLIEADEFDEGARRVMNYGHSFGHAIESATDFGIPHGVAVTIGMDMANWVAVGLGLSTPNQFERMHPALAKNYRGFERTAVPLDRLLGALGKDKKNTAGKLMLVLPDRDGRIGLVPCANDSRFHGLCRDYLEHGRAA